MTEEHVEMLVGYPNDIAEGMLIPRDEIHQKGILHNVVHVIIHGTRDYVPVVWLQWRASNKTLFPNKYDFTITGHVDGDENFDDAAQREIEEEAQISIPKEQLVYIGREHQVIDPRPDGGVDNEIAYTFVHKIDGIPEFKLSEEIQDFVSVSISELTEVILNNAESLNAKSIKGLSRTIYKDQLCCIHNREWKHFLKYFSIIGGR